MTQRDLVRALPRGPRGQTGPVPQPSWVNDVSLGFTDANGDLMGSPANLLGPEGPSGDARHFDTVGRLATFSVAAGVDTCIISRYADGGPVARMTWERCATIPSAPTNFIRSVDRNMPGGGADAVNGGYWRLAESIVSPEMYPGSTDTARLQAAWDSGATYIRLQPLRTYTLGQLNLASNMPRTLDMRGSMVVLTASGVAALTIKGSSHRILPGLVVQQNANDQCQFARVTNTDVLGGYPVSESVTFEGGSLESIYRGVEVDMAFNGSGVSCYRARIVNVNIRNWTQQSAWAGSFGVKFGGPNNGDAGGNDSRIVGGIIKGYDRNVIVQNSAATVFESCSMDYGGTCIQWDAGSDLTIIGGYYEYNTVWLEPLNSPTRLIVPAEPVIAGYTTLIAGGTSALAANAGRKIVGRFSDAPGVTESFTGYVNSKMSDGIVDVGATAVNGVWLHTYKSDNSDAGVIRVANMAGGLGFDFSTLTSAFNRVIAAMGTAEIGYIGNVDGTTGTAFATSGDVYPLADAANNVGKSNKRYVNIYATNGTIQTSDGEEKDLLGGLTAAEIAAAREIATMGAKWRWKGKGESARIHFGFVAQDVIAVMQRHGLDPYAYSMICRDERDNGSYQFGLRYSELQAFLFAASGASSVA